METEEELHDGGSVEEEERTKLEERLHLLGRIAERRTEDRRVTYLDRHPEVDKFHHDADFQQCLDMIRMDDIRCSVPSCRCKIPSRDAEGWRVRSSKPVRRILSHQQDKGGLWFLCQLASARSGPELRKQCQVSTELRQEYAERLKRAGKSYQKSDVWDRQKEIAVREEVHVELDGRQKLINDQLIQCENTKEWAEKTKNAKQLTNISVSPVRQAKNPGPMGRDEETGKKLYKVERILGVEWYEGKMWYLIKWEGWVLEESTWEVNVQAQECVDYFYKIFGKPFELKKKVLSPEGEEFEKWEKEHKTLTPVRIKGKSHNGKSKSLKRKKDETKTPVNIPPKTPQNISQKTPLVSPEIQVKPINKVPQAIEVITISDDESVISSVSPRVNKVNPEKDVRCKSRWLFDPSDQSSSESPERERRKKKHRRVGSRDGKKEGRKVEAIVQSCRKNGTQWYLVRWSGGSDSCWESDKDLRAAKHTDAIQLYISQTKERRRTAPMHCPVKKPNDRSDD